MIAEVISFGGCWKDVRAIVRSRHRFQKEENVRLKQESDEKTILVQIKIKQRDNRKTVKIDNPGQANHGKEVENKRYGMFYYETVDTLELEQATPQEVKEAVLRGLTAASKK